MAKCSKCGEPLSAGVKFCASCGTPVKQVPKKRAPAEPTAAKESTAAGIGGMGIFAVIVVTAACAVIVVFFFFPFFAVSITGSVYNSYLAQFLPGSLDELNTNVSGIEAAVGRNGSSRVVASPFLLLVWFLSVAMLVALFVPKVREKLDSIQLPVINIPVIGGMGIYAYLAIIIAITGLIVLIAAYPSTMGYLRRESETSNAVLSLLGSVRLENHAGTGFVMSVIAHIVLLGIPFADKYFLSKR